MRNPWIKKNPLMSLWLSGANAVASTVRSRASAEARRQASTLMTRGIRQVSDFWSGVLAPPSRKRRKSR